MALIKENGEERERFWNELDRIVDRVCNGYRLCMPGDLNGWIGDRVRAGIIGSFGVPEENDNRRRVVEFCAERGLFVGILCFEHKSLLKYTRVPRGQDRAKIKSIIDMMLVKKDVRAVRGIG